MATEAKTKVKVEGRELQLSNLDKILYPQVGFTKAQVIDYYTRVAPVLLPHLRGRLLTLKRYPNGVEGEHFYEKKCPSHRPHWVHTKARWSDRNKKEIDYCVIDDLPTLVWSANLANLELHTSLSVAKNVDRPTVVAFDLDPGAPADILDCAEIALELKEFLESLGLESFPKTSGSKGMQVYVPLNTPATFEKTKPFALAVAEALAEKLPKRIVTSMKKELRKGRVLIDWSQNDDYKTTVCVYSLRAKQVPTVSTPIEWSEVMEALDGRDPSLLSFNHDEALTRVNGKGDLFESVLSMKQKLPKVAALR